MTASVKTLGTLANGLLLQREAAERARSHRGNDRVVQPHPACSAIVTRYAVPAGRALVAADIVARRGLPGRSHGRAFRRAGPSRPPAGTRTRADTRSFGEAVRNLCGLVGERHRRSAHVEPATARLARARRTLMRIPGG